MAPVRLVDDDPHQDYTPPWGAYIVITLDAVKTLEVYKDSIATAAAEDIPKRMYVGYANSGVGVPSPYRKYHELGCVLLCKGRPEPDPAHGIEEMFYVPVGSSIHPNGRQSVNPSPPLPWHDLYHHTVPNTNFRFATRLEDYRECSVISGDDMEEFDFFACSDKVRAPKIQRKYEKALQSTWRRLASALGLCKSEGMRWRRWRSTLKTRLPIVRRRRASLGMPARPQCMTCTVTRTLGSGISPLSTIAPTCRPLLNLLMVAY
ncbi:hypothetical protein FA95DRAFT_617947 [Auriscalpium vulgare]|uniref:Uncharacterized protein n=1 Tax=Auriscalpium vulgare TaxID=40419 RepID=A0ACB8REP5_9AGAM|nr:hypothetical protein FA95DRAFT_617947 [Auriscalpium vulgare]